VLQLESERCTPPAGCLLPEYAWEWQKADGEPHADRVLFRIAEFDPERPVDKRRQVSAEPVTGP
jgi:hypothetical protein